MNICVFVLIILFIFSGGARFPPTKGLALPTEGLILLENDRARGRQGIVRALETEGKRS